MSPTVGNIAPDRGDPLKIELNDQERRAVRKLLTERKARLIEITEDTTQPDRARRAGLIELLTIASMIGKLRHAISRNRCS
jgi:uncharacterized membrane protein